MKRHDRIDQRFLKKKPLIINAAHAAHAAEIDKAVKSAHVKKIQSNYNSAISSGATKFEDLPAEAQTVIASVSFQYGSNLKSRAPKFWKSVTSQD